MASHHSVAITSTTPNELVEAFRRDEEEFFGLPYEKRSEAIEPDSDEEEISVDIEDIYEDIAALFTASQDNTDVMIEDLDVEKQSIEDHLKMGCGCTGDCYDQFSFDELYSIRLQMNELEKSEKDMLVLGKLQILSRGDDIKHARTVTSAKRQRITFRYAYDHRSVCKDAFCFLHSIGEKVLKNLQKHLKDHGITSRIHGNKGRLPPNAFSFETVKALVDFIQNYAVVFGLPQPAAQSGRAKKAPIYLPASENYITVHNKYVESCILKDRPAAKYHSFRQIWLHCVPHIKFMTPRTDVCETCENFRVSISTAVLEDEKLSLSEQFQSHVNLAQKERQYYLDSSRKAEESLQSCSPGGHPLYCHYTFDFAQLLQIPYHARQVGPIYFKVPLKVQLFGICNDGNHKQVNYLFSESECIGKNGTKAHGANAVISMLHHYFKNHAAKEKDAHLHADNCVGQNKNRYVVGYLVWRVLSGLNSSITLSFMRVGHTRCIVDGNFGLIKQLYRQSDVDTVRQLASIVGFSSSSNIPQLYPWEWREWDAWLEQFFTAVKGIRKIYHFRVTADMGGKIAVRTECDGNEKKISIIKKEITPADIKSAPLPSAVPPAGMTRERQEYLYSKIREHVWPHYRDITCPRPQ